MIHLDRLVRGYRAGRLSRNFSRAFEAGSDRPPWIGLEHEFPVFDGDGGRVDFRTVIQSLRLGRPDLVPGDRNAYRLPSGSVVTADTTEAEIATPPVDLRPGFASRLDAWAAHERAVLADRVSPMTIRGDSTHLNVTLPADVAADRVADAFATRFSVGLMLLMDRRTSPGLLVRPRPYRLELGGEYVVGDALRAALAYAVGATLACVAWLRWPGQVDLPPPVALRLERGVLRYGWYVDRSAFGVDLYAAGRRARLVTRDGTPTTAQAHMRQAWELARAHLEPHVAAGDLRDAENLVGGRFPLPMERPANALEAAIARPCRPRSPFGTALRAVRRPEYDVAPVMLTWQAAVFLAARRDRRRAGFLTVPGAALGSFVERLRRGELDELVDAYLAQPPAGRRLSNPAQVNDAGLYDELGLRAGLLAPERDYWGHFIRHRAPGHSVPAGAGLARA